MKRLIVLITFLGSVMVMNGQEVQRHIAEKLAVNFMDARSEKDLVFQESMAVIDPVNSEALYYMINFYPEGYVIVSGDYRMMPVLAYSFNSTIDFNKENPAFLWWMLRYEEEIQYVRKNKLLAQHDILEKWIDFLDGNIPQPKVQLEPLLTTTWDQGTYYNEQCPEDENGPDDKCLTGCVATAIGQLMNYFRWPQTGTGFYTSEDTVYGTLSVDYSAANYKFNEMAVDLRRSNPETAELIYNIGVSVDMHYGPNGSGMNNHKAAHTMKTFFRYVDSTQYIFRDSVSLDWDSVMIAHLDQKLPMYYAGWADTMFVSGHAFVCDGYQDSTYFHFNWGWGGSYDGFFYVYNLSPRGSSFTLMHELVINMYPEGTYPYYCNGTDTLRSLDGTIDDGSGPLFDYQDNTSCSWLIAPDDSISGIKMNFLRLNTETGNDIITIYDGPDSGSPVLGTYSGATLPSEIISTGGEVFITFISDGASTNGGFLMTYEAEKYSYCNALTSMTSESDTIEDGSGTYDYQGNVFCRWIIEPASGDPLLLGFINFDMDSTDFVRVFDHTNSQLLGEFRGNSLPPDLYSGNGTMTVYFKTNATAHADGFKLWYRTSPASVEENEIASWQLYPNPAEDFFNVSGIVGKVQIRVYDLSGKLLYDLCENSDNNMITVNTSAWKKGLYMIEVESENGLAIFKLVK